MGQEVVDIQEYLLLVPLRLSQPLATGLIEIQADAGVPDQQVHPCIKLRAPQAALSSMQLQVHIALSSTG